MDVKAVNSSKSLVVFFDKSANVFFKRATGLKCSPAMMAERPAQGKMKMIQSPVMCANWPRTCVIVELVKL